MPVEAVAVFEGKQESATLAPGREVLRPLSAPVWRCDAHCFGAEG